MSLQTMSIIFFVGFLTFVAIVAFVSSRNNGGQGESADVEYYL